MMQKLNCFVHVLKVLNGKVAEEMGIVENHLIALTSVYYFYSVGLFVPMQHYASMVYAMACCLSVTRWNSIGLWLHCV